MKETRFCWYKWLWVFDKIKIQDWTHLKKKSFGEKFWATSRFFEILKIWVGLFWKLSRYFLISLTNLFLRVQNMLLAGKKRNERNQTLQILIEHILSAILEEKSCNQNSMIFLWHPWSNLPNLAHFSRFCCKDNYQTLLNC